MAFAKYSMRPSRRLARPLSLSLSFGRHSSFALLRVFILAVDAVVGGWVGLV